jgi:ribosomal protein S18 acetylase RimI-like enzyme
MSLWKRLLARYLLRHSSRWLVALTPESMLRYCHNGAGCAAERANSMNSEPNFSLRPATAKDYDFLYRLHAVSMRPYVELLWGWEEAWQQEYFARKFDVARRKIIQIDGQDAGVLVVEQRAYEIYLALIEILPAYQGKGVGTAIISSLLETAREKGEPVILHVLKSNTPARRLYERLGFVIAAEEDYRYKMAWNAPDQS